MSSPIYLRNSLRFSRYALPISIISRIPSASASSSLSYSTDSNPNRTEANRSERIPTNDPSPPPPVPNVSESNAVPTSTWGKQDALLQEDLEAAEQRRTMQAPNRQNVWSRSQERREVAMRGPRFEQTIMELQVCRTLFYFIRLLLLVLFWYYSAVIVTLIVGIYVLERIGLMSQ